MKEKFITGEKCNQASSEFFIVYIVGGNINLASAKKNTNFILIRNMILFQLMKACVYL